MIADLIKAEEHAKALFKEAEQRDLLVPGQTEKDLNTKLFQLAEELFGIKKYWHKRIVRAGKNTLQPYKENPPDLELKEDEIIFFDFGPVFEEWEADLGRTYVLGNDPLKHKLKEDVEKAWHIGKQYFDQHYSTLTGAEFYSFTCDLAHKLGWEFGGVHCGHLIGNFPHENIATEIVHNYLHPDNPTLISAPYPSGEKRYWIYEIHLVDKEKQIGGFFEQLISSAG